MAKLLWLLVKIFVAFTMIAVFGKWFFFFVGAQHFLVSNNADMWATGIMSFLGGAGMAWLIVYISLSESYSKYYQKKVEENYQYFRTELDNRTRSR